MANWPFIKFQLLHLGVNQLLMRYLLLKCANQNRIFPKLTGSEITRNIQVVEISFLTGGYVRDMASEDTIIISSITIFEPEFDYDPNWRIRLITCQWMNSGQSPPAPPWLSWFKNTQAEVILRIERLSSVFLLYGWSSLFFRDRIYISETGLRQEVNVRAQKSLNFKVILRDKRPGVDKSLVFLTRSSETWG